MAKVSQAVRERYNAKTYDKITIRTRKDAEPTKAQIQAAADAAGESLNSYIINAIKQRLKGGE